MERRVEIDCDIAMSAYSVKKVWLYSENTISGETYNPLRCDFNEAKRKQKRLAEYFPEIRSWIEINPQMN